MSIESVYGGLLGRSPDQGAYGTYAGWSDEDIANAIYGSQEFANKQSSSQSQQQQQSGGGGADINSLYRQYLGRDVDPSGAATYAGWNPQDIVNAITGSQEYKQRQGSSASPTSGSSSDGNPQDLANKVFSLYRTNQNYDQALNELNAAPQNADYYRARIGLLGKQMGWQIGQNTGDRNSVYQQELASYLPGARAAGLTDAEINNLINSNSATQSAVNQERIASDAKVGQGWVNQNIPGGYTTLAALAAAAAAPYALEFFAPELLGGAAAEGAGASGFGGLTGSSGYAGTGILGGATGGAGGISVPTGFGALGLDAATEAAIAAGAGAGLPAAGTSVTGAAIGQSLGGIGGLNAALPAAGAGEFGSMSAALAPNSVLGTGLAGGGAIGGSYLLGANGLPAVDMFGTPITASSVGIGGYPASTGVLDTLSNALSGLSPTSALSTAALGSTALKAITGGTTPTAATPTAAPSTYAPKGQVGYDPLLSLLAPRLITRNQYSLLG
jgi:hypothetical protein